MKVDHIAIYVENIEKMKDFFTAFFGACANGGYHNKNTGLRTYFLSFDSGARLELMQRPGMTDVQKGAWRTGYTHVAFSVGSKRKVDGLTAALAEAGYTVLSGPRTTGDGYYESLVLGPEETQLEITV